MPFSRRNLFKGAFWAGAALLAGRHLALPDKTWAALPRSPALTITNDLQTAWQKIVANRRDQLGVYPTATTIDFGQNPAAEMFASTSFAPESIGPLWTPSKPLNTWQSPITWKGIIPMLPFNGVDEWLATPSSSYWHGGDGVNDFPMSFMAWVEVFDVPSIRDIIMKYSGANWGEWEFGVGVSNDFLRFHIYDFSVWDSPSIYKEFAPYLGRLTQVGFTYGGQGGPYAIDDAELYINGQRQQPYRDNRAVYVAMEPRDSPVYLGTGDSGDWHFKGRMAGWPCSPIFGHAKWSDSFFADTYALERQAFGV